ncbi:hypothetical protein RsTz2092_01100 [Deferribacterales bacterium RsTz2092]|nr:hypothetical protein AGMMS49941_04560 [Deferribacterales bacterium]
MDTRLERKRNLIAKATLAELYASVVDIMTDFGYSIYKSVKEVADKRRIELWSQKKSQSPLRSLVWIEAVGETEAMNEITASDVMRVLYDEGVTELFFFANSSIGDDVKEILEGPNHYILSKDEIIETLLSIENNKALTTVVRKRNNVRIASGLVVIKNFFKQNTFSRNPINVRMSATMPIVEQYRKMILAVIEQVDSVSDIYDVPSATMETLKHMQFDLLPEMMRTPNFVFHRQIGHVKNLLFRLIELCIIYIGNFINYESEDSLRDNRAMIEELLENIDRIGMQIATFRSDTVYYSERSAVKIIVTSLAVMFVAMMLLIVVRFGK